MAETLALRGAYVPQICSLPVEQDRSGVSFFIRFVPALLNAGVRAVCEQAAGLMAPGMLLYIADDMGLGETLQAITTLQRLKEDDALAGDQKALVVAPTTLLTNWSKEIARLRLHVYHGPGRSLKPLNDCEMLLSTYGVVRSQIAEFQKKNWPTSRWQPGKNG